MLEIDTTSGGSGPLAPPEDWTGSADDYMALIHDRIQHHPAASQQIRIASTLVGHTVTGPHADQARQILKSIKERK